MKVCGAILILVLTVGLLGCGRGEETATSADGSSRGRTATETTQAQTDADHPFPKLPPNRGPLKKLFIKDLEIGKGPKARWGDEVLARYVAVYWKTGKIFTLEWGRESELYGFELDPRASGSGWMKGLHGMRVGGWRELRIPSDLLYDGGDAAYVVTLVRVKPGVAK